MALIRYTASADTTIANAFQSNLNIRASGSNMGASDILEVFSVYGRETTSSQELSRVLIKFPVTDISTDRTNSIIPASGSVSFYLRLFNAEHSKTVPEDFTLMVRPVAQSWQEGVGLDLEDYKDVTKGLPGANWMSASNAAVWTSSAGEVGGSYLTGTSDPTFKGTFSTGLENLEINVTPLVEHWIAGTISNNGFGIHLTSSQEALFSGSDGLNSGSVLNNTGGAETSYYTKRFFARGTQYFFSQPLVEARWNSSVKDDRGDFMYSSSLAPPSENLNTIYLYNYVRGQLTNIPAINTTGSILVSLYSGSATNTSPSGSKLLLYDGNTNLTGGYVSTGIYSCSVATTAASTPVKTLFDVWHSGSIEFFTGSITPSVLSASSAPAKPTYYLNITNLRDRYRRNETVRFNVYIRNKNWSPTIYNKATATTETTTIHSASFRTYRILDAHEAVPYGTGSDLHTVLSYGVSGNYFDFDMSLLESGYVYGFKFAFYDAALSSWTEQPYIFKFRVEDYGY